MSFLEGTGPYTLPCGGFTLCPEGTILSPNDGLCTKVDEPISEPKPLYETTQFAWFESDVAMLLDAVINASSLKDTVPESADVYECYLQLRKAEPSSPESTYRGRKLDRSKYPSEEQVVQILSDINQQPYLPNIYDTKRPEVISKYMSTHPAIAVFFKAKLPPIMYLGPN